MILKSQAVTSYFFGVKCLYVLWSYCDNHQAQCTNGVDKKFEHFKIVSFREYFLLLRIRVNFLKVRFFSTHNMILSLSICWSL